MKLSKVVQQVLSFLVAVGVVTYLWANFTKNIYKTEILSVKDYYGRLTVNDQKLTHYIFVKIKFSKPWYAYKVKIFPKELRVPGSINDQQSDIYKIVEGLKANEIFLPYVQTAPRLLSEISIEEGKEYVSTIAPDLVAKKIGKCKTAETFEDVRNYMLEIPFMLDSDDKVQKIFIFKLVGEKKRDYSTRSMGLGYLITGKNIHEGPYSFHTYLYVADISNFSPCDQTYIYCDNSRMLMLKGKYQKALESLERAKITHPGSYLPHVLEGLINIYQNDIELGNERIKSHIKLLSINEANYVLPGVIQINMAKNRDGNSAIEFYTDYAQEMFPQSVTLKEFEAIQLFMNGNFTKALAIYEVITPFLIDSEIHYKSLIRKGFVCYHLQKYKISNYYLLSRLDILKKDDSIDKNFIECVNMVIGANYYFSGETKNAERFFSELTTKGWYWVEAQKILKGEKPLIRYGYFLFDTYPPKFVDKK